MWFYLILFTTLITTTFTIIKIYQYPFILTIAKNLWLGGFGLLKNITKQYITRIISKRFVEVHHKHYKVHYPYGIHWYTILIPRNRTPSTIDKIIGFETLKPFTKVDVTETIKSVIGPCNNFHGIPTTPKMLGYSRLIFHNSFTETQKEFIDDQVIDFVS